MQVRNALLGSARGVAGDGAGVPPNADLKAHKLQVADATFEAAGMEGREGEAGETTPTTSPTFRSGGRIMGASRSALAELLF